MPRLTPLCALILLATGAVCTRTVRSGEEAVPETPLKLLLSIEEDELFLEVNNVSEKRVSVITRLEPGFGVVSLAITDGKGKGWPCGGETDWIVQELSEIAILPPGGKIRSFLPLDNFKLPHGTYKAKATYEVGRNSYFFFKQWFDPAQEPMGKPTGELWSRIRNLWAGRISSNSVELRVKEDLLPQELPKDVKALRGLLQSPKVSLRVRAIQQLGKLGEEAVVAAPDFAGLLENEHRVVRLAALDALKALGLRDPVVVSCLCKALAAKDPDTRRGALYAFWGAERIPDEALPSLAKVFSDDEWSVRLVAAMVAGSIGPSAHELKPALKRLMLDENEAVRRHAFGAYTKVLGTSDKGTEKATPAR